MTCRWTEAVLALIVLVFTIWSTQIFSAGVSWWLVVIAAVLLIIHSLFCHKCGGLCRTPAMKSSRKKRR